MFKIEKNVVKPPHARSKYPWHQMSVGDSFFVKDGDRNRLAASAGQRGIRNNEKYTVRKVDGGYRVWRTA